MVPGFLEIARWERHQWNPHVGDTSQPAKARGEDADDGVRHAVQSDRAPKKIPIASKAPHPEAVTKHGEGRRSRSACLVRRERAAGLRLHAQNLEIARLDHLADDPLG